MEAIVEVQGLHIGVVFREHSVHISNSKALRQLIAAAPDANTRLFVEQIFAEYRQRFQRDFAIHPDSLIVEIWGHVYFEQYTLIVERMVKLKLVSKIADKLVAYCETIDCGEAGHDDNRALWDGLAPFVNIIAGWLPELKHRADVPGN